MIKEVLCSYMSFIARKPGFVAREQQRDRPACTFSQLIIVFVFHSLESVIAQIIAPTYTIFNM